MDRPATTASHAALVRAMTKTPFLPFLRASLLLVATTGSGPAAFGAVAEPPLNHRVLWTNSHVLGSPEPPLPYTVQKTFTNIHWRAPIFVIAEPDNDALLVVQQGGEKER